MEKIYLGNQKPFLLVVLIGILGGAALILSTLLTSNGPAILIPFSILFIATFAVVKTSNWPSYSKRFTISFLIFMLSTIILYLHLVVFQAGTLFDIPLFGHIWRLGFLASISGILSLVIAYFTKTKYTE